MRSIQGKLAEALGKRFKAQRYATYVGQGCFAFRLWITVGGISEACRASLCRMNAVPSVFT